MSRVQADYDVMSATYDRDRVASYVRCVRAYIVRLAGPSPIRVLEIGSGTGEYCLALAAAGHEARGLDLSPSMVEAAGEKAAARGAEVASRLRFARGNAEEGIPFEGPFDMALSIDSWECFDRPGAVLSAASSVLRPGGRVAIVTPNNWLMPLFVVAEALGIKRNRPAFHHNHSFRGPIARWGTEAGLVYDRSELLFHGTTRAFHLYKPAPISPRT